MSWKVISPRSCRESAQSLMGTLNDAHPIHANITINWGNSTLSRNDPLTVYGNKLEAVGRSVNKQIFFDTVKDLGTVPVVQEYQEPGVYQHNAYLSDGRGVVFVDNPGAFNPHLLSTKRIIGDEYRVYFVYNTIVGIFKKVKLEDNNENPIQCSRTGYGYQENPSELSEIENLDDILKEYTYRVANRIELSYGAVDFIVEKDTHMVYILESNAAPTLMTQDLLRSFANHFAWRYNERNSNGIL